VNDTIDAGGLRREIRGKYRDVAVKIPHGQEG
jgi:hypothetical protein